MANEASIQSSLNIRTGNVNYQSQPTAFVADVTGAMGPTPGAVLVSTGGTDVDLSQLTLPGLARFMNIDATNFVEYGIWEPATSTFYPLGELLPGESFVLRLSRNLREQYAGTGTGTTGPENTLRFKANRAAARVVIDIFER